MKYSIYAALTLIVTLTVSTVMIGHGYLMYADERDRTIFEAKIQTEETLNSLTQNIVDLVESYSVNEYENLLKTEVDNGGYLAILVEDRNMGSILGVDQFVTGYLHDENWNIISFNPENPQHTQILANSFFEKSSEITSSMSESLGVLTIYNSDREIQKSLETMVYSHVVDTVLISTILIVILIILLRHVVLKPVYLVQSSLQRTDDAGIPIENVAVKAPREIEGLENSINTMIEAIRSSRHELEINRNQLQEERDRFQLAVEGSEDGLWDWNPVTDKVFFSKRWKEMLGYEDHEIQDDLKEWSDRVHPDDIEQVKKDVSAHLNGETAIYENRHRVRTKDKAWKWILDRGKAQFNDNGEALRFVGFHTDITQQIQYENSIKERAAHTKAIINNIVDGIVTINARGKIQTVNPAVCKMFGYDEVELLGKNVKILMPSPHQEQHDSYLQNYFVQKTEGIFGLRREVDGLTKEGIEFPIELIVTELQTTQGNIFVGVLRDLTEKRHLEKLKSQFVSSVSHELRTPLTVMLGYVPILKNPEQLPDVKMLSQIAEKIEFSGNHLLDIVNDLLDYSKLEAGKMSLNYEMTDVAELISNSVQHFEPLAEKKGIALEANLKPVEATIDPLRVKQVIFNVIGNAIKFTDTGGIVVTLSVNADENVFKFTIRDTGCGIDQNELEYVFDHFRQVDGSATRSAGGTGLGLAISKSLVDLHGGTMTVESELGVGTAFHVAIPLSPKN